MVGPWYDTMPLLVLNDACECGGRPVSQVVRVAQWFEFIKWFEVIMISPKSHETGLEPS